MITPGYSGCSVVGMTAYLIECYCSHTNAAQVEVSIERARLTAEQVTNQGRPVRPLLSIFVPQDETWFLLYEAGCAEAVRETARLANLPVDRITVVTARSYAAGSFNSTLRERGDVTT